MKTKTYHSKNRIKTWQVLAFCPYFCPVSKWVNRNIAYLLLHATPVDSVQNDGFSQCFNNIVSSMTKNSLWSMNVQYFCTCQCDELVKMSASKCIKWGSKTHFDQIHLPSFSIIYCNFGLSVGLSLYSLGFFTHIKKFYTWKCPILFLFFKMSLF